MKRNAIEYLIEWKQRKTRKPLVLRGARQVGKSYLVRMLAENEFDNLCEINFEKTSGIEEVFYSNNPKEIVANLNTRPDINIIPGKTLLFLDEIQNAPKVLATLRYFYELMPELHIISAGSLLEFALENISFSLPVGRIEYMYLGPMTFEEFLLANNRESLLEYLNNYSLSTEIPSLIHNDLLKEYKTFCLTGGMPESVQNFIDSGSYEECSRSTENILTTYRDDFSKYGKNTNYQRLETVFTKIPFLVGKNFKYTLIDPDERSRDLKQSMHLLENARILTRILHSDANGLPIGAESHDRRFKIIILDVGLLVKACGLRASELLDINDIILINSGAVCEQFIGQHLLYSQCYYETPELYYWSRQQKASNSEIDYLINYGTKIIPVEVKAGKSGTLKSLHYFIEAKKYDFALRFNSDKPSIIETKTVTIHKKHVPFRLLSLPFYLVSQYKRLLKENL